MIHQGGLLGVTDLTSHKMFSVAASEPLLVICAFKKKIQAGNDSKNEPRENMKF